MKTLISSSPTFSARTVSLQFRHGDVDRKRSPDDDQLRYAAKNEYVILTHKRGDFERLAFEYFNENRSHAGIVVSVQRPPKEVASAIIRVLTRYTAEGIKNQIVYI